MTIYSNVPECPHIVVDGVLFERGHKVRVLTKKKQEYLGRVAGIEYDRFNLRFKDLELEAAIKFADVAKMRMAKPDEDLNSEPYFDDEEKEFWRTHWVTKDGIAEKTPEEIKMLEERR